MKSIYLIENRSHIPPLRTHIDLGAIQAVQSVVTDTLPSFSIILNFRDAPLIISGAHYQVPSEYMESLHYRLMEAWIEYKENQVD